jgi:hypothetical protein
MGRVIFEKNVKLKEQQLRIETLEFLLCGGKHEWGEVDKTVTYDAHGEAYVDTICICKRCHKRIVV